MLKFSKPLNYLTKTKHYNFRFSTMFPLKKTFFDLRFQNLISKTFDIEPNPTNEVHQVSNYLYSKVNPTPLKSPHLISLSPSALSLLDLPAPETLISSQNGLNPSLDELLSGNKLHSDSKPVAHNYSGYQFGQFAGQLGDGRALTLGDIINEKGEVLELQLKGSGLTPYSRFADGRAVLRSSIREFLCSEAMFHLGIPTTRALSIVKGEDTVLRDLLYDGHPRDEKCAVILRISPSFVRFGSFEFMIGERNNKKVNEKEVEMMNKLLDFLLKHHYSQIKTESKPRNIVVSEFYKEVVTRTARLVALWQCYGFCHGVLNTDNMSILGLTMDYGPFGFLDYCDLSHICNHSDHSGRYSFENQPLICKWNLMRLAEALSILVPFEELKDILKVEYEKNYDDAYYRRMRQKLGLFSLEKKEDVQMIKDFIELMNETKLDFTNAFRRLADFDEFNDSEEYILKFSNFLCELSPSEDIFLDFHRIPITEQQLIEVSF